MTPTARAGEHVAVLVDDAGLQTVDRLAQAHQSTGVALRGGNGPVQYGQQVGVDLVDDHAGATLGERHRDRRLGHSVRGHDGLATQAERGPGFAQVLDVDRVDLFGTGKCPAQ